MKLLSATSRDWRDSYIGDLVLARPVLTFGREYLQYVTRECETCNNNTESVRHATIIQREW